MDGHRAAVGEGLPPTVGGVSTWNSGMEMHDLAPDASSPVGTCPAGRLR